MVLLEPTRQPSPHVPDPQQVHKSAEPGTKENSQCGKTHNLPKQNFPRDSSLQMSTWRPPCPTSHVKVLTHSPLNPPSKCSTSIPSVGMDMEQIITKDTGITQTDILKSILESLHHTLGCLS